MTKVTGFSKGKEKKVFFGHANNTFEEAYDECARHDAQLIRFDTRNDLSHFFREFFQDDFGVSRFLRYYLIMNNGIGYILVAIYKSSESKT